MNGKNMAHFTFEAPDNQKRTQLIQSYNKGWEYSVTLANSTQQVNVKTSRLRSL